MGASSIAIKIAESALGFSLLWWHTHREGMQKKDKAKEDEISASKKSTSDSKIDHVVIICEKITASKNSSSDSKNRLSSYHM